MLLSLVALGGCSHPHEPDRDQVRLYAAASLTDVMGELTARFEKDEGVRIVASYGASNVLAQQIHEGAAPGVFVSASVEWVEKLEQWGDVEPRTRVDLLTNSLVVIVPKGATERPARLEDLADARFRRIALADPAAVPAGKYARAALEKVNVFETLRARIVAAADVRGALTYVERGDAPVGIVYASDAAQSAGVEVALRIAPELHPGIVYPLVLVKGASPEARRLRDFLGSDTASAVYRRAGFLR